jgi:tRNA(Ile)-lysidine synthase
MLPKTRLKDWVDIPHVGGISLVRPLLEIRRSQTEGYCMQMGIKPIQDPSNQDPSFFRNRIRHHLIPFLKEFNPGIEEIILRMAKVMLAETRLIDRLLQEEWGNIVLKVSEGAVHIQREQFGEMPLALQRSLIRRIIKKLKPDIRNLGFEHVEQAVRFLTDEPHPNKLPLLAGLEILNLSTSEAVLLEERYLITFPEYPQLTTQTMQKLFVPHLMELQSGWVLKTEQMELTTQSRAELLQSLDAMTAALDLRSVEGELHVRSINPGDRIQPLGMAGSIKVSDLFINNKIPQPVREHWPLVVDKEKVVWVVGLRIHNRCRITTSTEEIILVQVKPPEEKSI